MSGRVLEYQAYAWPPELLFKFSIKPGRPRDQAFFEGCALLCAMLSWCIPHRDTGLRILGDATGAMEALLHLKGKGQLNHVARELAWRRVKYGWCFRLGHVPSEFNNLADCLSRMYSPSAVELPLSCIAAHQVSEPDWVGMWRALVWHAPRP